MLEILTLAITLMMLGPAILLGLLVCGGLHLFGDLAGLILGGFAVLLVVLAAAGLAFGMVAAVVHTVFFW